MTNLAQGKLAFGRDSVPSKPREFTAFKSEQLGSAQINPFVNRCPWSLQPVYIWDALVMLSVSAWGKKNQRKLGEMLTMWCISPGLPGL